MSPILKNNNTNLLHENGSLQIFIFSFTEVESAPLNFSYLAFVAEDVVDQVAQPASGR